MNKQMIFLNEISTYALTLTPIAMSLEELIPSNHPQFLIFSILIRTALVISTLLVGLGIPFFGTYLLKTSSEIHQENSFQ